MKAITRNALIASLLASICLAETPNITSQQAAAHKRAAEDTRIYSADQLREIESLYQVANKRWNTPEAIASLKQLIEKYSRANRTGCAILYLGQMSEGEKKEAYLKQAIREFEDCFYFDGVQVGAYARFCLATYYQFLGKEESADALVDGIRSNYPNAIDHRGRPLLAERQSRNKNFDERERQDAKKFSASEVYAQEQTGGRIQGQNLTGTWFRKGNPRTRAPDKNFTFKADGTFSVAGYPDQGTWKVDGSTVTLTWLKGKTDLNTRIYKISSETEFSGKNRHMDEVYKRVSSENGERGATAAAQAPAIPTTACAAGDIRSYKERLRERQTQRTAAEMAAAQKQQDQLIKLARESAVKEIARREAEAAQAALDAASARDQSLRTRQQPSPVSGLR